MNIFLAIVNGLIFGIALQLVGASNPKKVLDMLSLKDFSLMKIILGAIAISSIALFLFLNLGIINAGHISIKSAYTGVIVGGLIFGIGWGVSGFCPGTSIVRAGEGKKDGYIFIVGGLIGAAIYMSIYGDISSSFLFTKLGGKITLIETVAKYKHIIGTIPSYILVFVVSIPLLLIAKYLPKKN